MTPRCFLIEIDGNVYIVFSEDEKIALGDLLRSFDDFDLSDACIAIDADMYKIKELPITKNSVHYVGVEL